LTPEGPLAPPEQQTRIARHAQEHRRSEGGRSLRCTQQAEQPVARGGGDQNAGDGDGDQEDATDRDAGAAEDLSCPGLPGDRLDEIAATTPTFAGVSFARLDAEGSMQWPVTQAAPHGTPTMHVGSFVRGLGQLTETVYVPTTERANRRFPLVLTTGRILSQYNVGAQTRRTPNSTWHPEDVLEIHPSDAELRGIVSGDVVELSSRVGTTRLTAQVSDRMPAGVVYTTFHHPETGANVVTTENSDWATNCPEYKVTAVQVEVVTQAARADVEAQAGVR